MKARRRLMVLLLALAGGLVAELARPSDLDQVRELADTGRVEKALRRLESFLVQEPEHLEGQFLRGVLLFERQRPIEAERVFEMLRRRHPDRPEPVNNLAVLQAASGRRGTALKALEEVVRAYPTYELAARNLESIRSGLGSEYYDPMSPDATRVQLLLSYELGSYPRMEPESSVADEPVLAVPIHPERPPPAAPEAEADRPERAAESTASPGLEPMGSLQPGPDRPTSELAEPEPAAPEPPGGTSADAPPAGGGDDLRTEITRTITAWAEAWSEQRVKEYLHFYAPGFQPAGGSSREAWEAERRQRVSAPRFIEVEVDLDSLELEQTAPGTVRVTFLQKYRSDRFGDTVRKTLELTREDGAWRIRRESTR